MLLGLILKSIAVAVPQNPAEVIWQACTSEYVAVWCQQLSPSLEECVTGGKGGAGKSVLAMDTWLIGIDFSVGEK